MTDYLMPRSTVPDFSRNPVLVAGDIMLDRYWHGTTRRISPEAPVPIVQVSQIEERVGGAGNVAMNVAALGGKAIVLGLIGNDANGDRLRELLKASRCEAKLIKVRGGTTITKLRVISQHQQLIRLDFEQAFAEHGQIDLYQALTDTIEKVAVLVLSDYAKGTLAAPETLIDIARKRGIPIVVDPKRGDFQAYRGASVATPNMQEFQALVGTCHDEHAILERGRHLLQGHDIGALLLTRGELGMTLIRNNAPARNFAARAREVFDVTGAGDTVVALVAAALAAGEPLERAAYIANIGAGLVVGKVGTATVTQGEIESELTRTSTVHQGIVSELELQPLVQEARQRNEKLVMTNGCFDILHPGHIAYLQQAAELGDRLIVAINDNSSVERLKGPDRPVNDLAHRMAVIAALRAVDWVLSFEEDTPERLICQLKPDFLVKGGDYRPEEIAGADCVREAGGEVLILPAVAGHSTTRLIQCLAKR